MTTLNRCRRCDHEKMKNWAQLNDDEREVVKRLPDSARYTPDERKLTHEWCIKCWNEQTTEARDA